MTIKLDKTKPISQIFGGGTPAVYYQNGNHFDAAGEYIELDPKDPTKVKKASGAGHSKQDKPKAMKAAFEVVEEKKAPAPEPKREADIAGLMKTQENGVVLAAWAAGEERHPWFTVKAALVDHYGENAPDTKAVAIDQIISDLATSQAG